MSGKLDQSLDEILSSQRKTAGHRRPARRSAGRPAATAPVGGVQKTSKPVRNNAAKPAPAKTARAAGESKVIVSNLPKDVSEGQIKEYFQTAVGQVKKVELSYGPGGVSRGIASVIFHHADGASKAFQKLNGLLIDNRPVKVEVVVASADLIPAPKTLSQRITQPKAQPKSAASDKATGVKAAGPAGKGANKKRPRGRNARPAKKTAEELDSEMADYFEQSNAAENAAGAAAPAAAANGDAAMEDEIM
ncbi:mRNA export protein mlo3 [Pleurostoma richardsiae]|uniref:mRNA export protein mlo3 n=1 Tax=Pleurostoma richardsiae TaxID=41990 RepID=A0AA38VKI8_9PEZI|nr:mRNA export protein mlo3 [Pleurostoma richardsiae]